MPEIDDGGTWLKMNPNHSGIPAFADEVSP